MVTVSRFPLPKPEISRFLCIFFWIIRLLASQRYFYLIFSIHWCFAENVIIFILILSTDIDGLLIVASWTDKNVSNDFSEFTTNTIYLEDKWTSPEKPETRETFSLLSKSYWMIFGFRYNDLFQAIYTWWEIKKSSRCHS